MQILLLEPYYGGSHRRWADGYVRHSQHDVQLLTLPAQAWKWRMQGGAVTLARLFNSSGLSPDVILASDMLDLSTFRSLTRHHTHDIPIALYFHENQLTYPQNSRQGHGWRYGFINYISAMSAEILYFNSAYHREVFFDTLPNMLKHFYDHNELSSISALQQRADVLPVGLNLRRYDPYQLIEHPDENTPPLILWNHRWEPDKNPRLFLTALRQLADEGISFQVALVGENVRHSAPEFESAREALGERVIAFGFQEKFEDYARLLWAADVVVSTSHQEFFGISIVEAIYCGCIPLLPDRLNYPALLPEEIHPHCLYPDDHDRHFTAALRRHLTTDVPVDRAALRRHIAAYDWSQVAARYDNVLTRLAQAPPPALAW